MIVSVLPFSETTTRNVSFEILILKIGQYVPSVLLFCFFSSVLSVRIFYLSRHFRRLVVVICKFGRMNNSHELHYKCKIALCVARVIVAARGFHCLGPHQIGLLVL